MQTALQLALCAHEGKWGKALELYDLMLSQSGGTEEAARAGVMLSLQKMACSSVLGMCRSALKRGGLGAGLASFHDTETEVRY